MYVAQSYRQQVLERIAQAQFFSLLMDGSTDKTNVDNKVFMAVWCDINGADKKIHTQTSYFHVGRPSTVDTAGLYQSPNIALRELGIVDLLHIDLHMFNFTFIIKVIQLKYVY